MDPNFAHAVELSPRRHTTHAHTVEGLVGQQLEHFGIDPQSAYGDVLRALTQALREANGAAHELWRRTVDTLALMDRTDRLAWFNAKRFALWRRFVRVLQTPDDHL